MSSDSTPSSPQPPGSPQASGSVDTSAAAQAALRRRLRSPAAKEADEKERFAKERDIRQKFRRLIDPGIVRPNSVEVTSLALQTLTTLAENLLREPSNPKFQSFKPTNDAIKKRIVEPPGALEYAIEMGFQPEVREFQPFYTWNPAFANKLRIGAEIIREAFKLDTEKRQRTERAQKEQKAAEAAVKRNIALAYAEDRKTKEINDERERIAREARAGRAKQPPPPPDAGAPPRYMPGAGIPLVGAAAADDAADDDGAVTGIHSDEDDEDDD